MAKYADGLPLYRQEAIYARDRVEIDRTQMGAVDGQDRLRARTFGRAYPGPYQVRRADLRRRNDPPDAGAKVRQDQDGLSLGLCSR